jgi:hypothetical protein
MGGGIYENSYDNLTIIFMKGYLQKANLKNLLTLIIKYANEHNKLKTFVRSFMDNNPGSYVILLLFSSLTLQQNKLGCLSLASFFRIT